MVNFYVLCDYLHQNLMVTSSTIYKWNSPLSAVVRCTCKLKISSALPQYGDVFLFRIGEVWGGAMEVYSQFS